VSRAGRSPRPVRTTSSPGSTSSLRIPWRRRETRWETDSIEKGTRVRTTCQRKEWELMGTTCKWKVTFVGTKRRGREPMYKMGGNYLSEGGTQVRK